MLRTTEKSLLRTEENVDIKKLLDKYEDVFPDELPKGLSPERVKGDFRIELKPGSNPVKKGLYVMSHTELEEIRSQITKLQDQGFIRPSTSP